MLTSARFSEKSKSLLQVEVARQDLSIVVDSGGSFHYTDSLEYLQEAVPPPTETIIETGTGEKVKIDLVGKMNIQFRRNAERVLFTDVYYSSKFDFGKSLIVSQGKLDDGQCSVLYRNSAITVKDEDNVLIATGTKMQNNLYILAYHKAMRNNSPVKMETTSSLILKRKSYGARDPEGKEPVQSSGMSASNDSDDSDGESDQIEGTITTELASRNMVTTRSGGVKQVDYVALDNGVVEKPSKE